MSRRYVAGQLTLAVDPLRVPSAPASIAVTTTSTTAVSVAVGTAYSAGGSAITSYSAVAVPNNTVSTAASSPLAITGLAQNTTYTFQAWATNLYGNGAPINTTYQFPQYLLGYLSDGANSFTTTNMVLDSSDNIYICGYGGAAGSTGYIFKLSPTGVVQWETTLTTFYIRGIGLDSSNNIYVSGSNSLTATTNNIQLAKLNNSGAVQWQNNYGFGASVCVGGPIAVNSIGIFMVASVNARPAWISFDTSGNFNAANGYNTTPNSWDVMASTPSGNQARCGWSGSTNLIYVSRITNTSSFGGSATTYTVSSAAATGAVKAMVYDNGLTAVYAAGNAAARPAIFSMTVSGGVSPSGFVNLVSAGATDSYYGVTIDSTDTYFYVAGAVTETTNTNLQIVRYDTATRTVQQQTAIKLSGNGVATAIKLNAAGTAIVISGYGNTGGGYTNPIFAVLPINGVGTGTYTVGGATFTYATTAFASGTSTTSSTSGVTTNSPGTATAATSSLTVGSGALTSTVTNI